VHTREELCPPLTRLVWPKVKHWDLFVGPDGPIEEFNNSVWVLVDDEGHFVSVVIMAKRIRERIERFLGTKYLGYWVWA
jgi:hypothetical protein